MASHLQQQCQTNVVSARQVVLWSVNKQKLWRQRIKVKDKKYL